MYSIIKNHVILKVMCVGSCTKLYSRVLFDIMLEYFCHIIIEYICVGACVHTNDCFFEFVLSVR